MAFIMFLYFLFQIVFLNLNDFCVIGPIVRERWVFLTWLINDWSSWLFFPQVPHINEEAAAHLQDGAPASGV